VRKIEETDLLIASDRVEGTAVYSHQDEHLGAEHDFMVGKSSGQFAYAVMSFGGFLGMGRSYHPLPWTVLHYDKGCGGFGVDLNRTQLEEAPSYMDDDAPNWSNRKYGNLVDSYYRMPPYWGMM
jgi:PRC-barrel domain